MERGVERNRRAPAKRIKGWGPKSGRRRQQLTMAELSRAAGWSVQAAVLERTGAARGAMVGMLSGGDQEGGRQV